jgi:hypothetical protein
MSLGNSAVVSVLTHACPWSPKSMGYYRVWVLAELVPGREPTRWTHEDMAYGRLWVITGMS